MRSERKHGLFTEQFPVSAYVGSSKNLKDLKENCSNCWEMDTTLDSNRASLLELGEGQRSSAETRMWLGLGDRAQIISYLGANRYATRSELGYMHHCPTHFQARY